MVGVAWGRGALIVGCVYMPTDSASVRLLEEYTTGGCA